MTKSPVGLADDFRVLFHSPQDISYHCCVELRGSRDKLLDLLGEFTSADVDCGFGGDVQVLSGQKEGRATLFHPGKSPGGVIGPASFIWRPSEAPDEEGTVWIWLHPGYSDELLEKLAQVLNLKREEDQEMDVDVPPEAKKAKKKDVLCSKLATRNVPHGKVPKFVSECGRVKVAVLRGTLNR